MEHKQNWQNYRSMIQDHLAVFSVNMDLMDMLDLPDSEEILILQFSLPYHPQSNGLPSFDEYQKFLAQMLKILTQFNATHNTFYAGHVLSNGSAQMYFYGNNKQSLLEVLQNFEVENIQIQADPEWAIYFDFLLPTPLEIKVNATEEMLETLSHNGYDLSDTYIIEHTLLFKTEEEMMRFMDKVNLNLGISFDIQYSAKPLKIEETEEAQYMVKLTHEIALDNADIYMTMDKLEAEILNHRYQAQYEGWGCKGIQLENKFLN